MLQTAGALWRVRLARPLQEQTGVEIQNRQKERLDMLGWAVTFLIVALIAAALGFTGIAGAAVGFAKILFVLFLVLFLLSLIFGRRHA